ncbi:hypothetical protein GF366_02590, partial [Candidatus Peregrinibacteria bacterium]|nr:hypothetical protein [Candidatus Peregrinibacteria bacterium]
KKIPSGIRSFIKHKNDKKTKYEEKNCDFFILGGGGLFGSLTFRANFIWAIQAFMAYRYEKPVLMYGQSIGIIKGFIRKFIIKKLFQKAELIAVRDEDSKKRLFKMGIKKEIHVIPDPAFRKTINIKDQSRNKEIVISLRQIDKIDKKFKREIINFLNKIVLDENYILKFIDFQKGLDGDHVLHEEIIKKLNNKEKIQYINQKNIEETFAKAEMVIGMRLHSIITAVKTITPFIAIDYAPKVEAFLKYTGFYEYSLKMEETGAKNMEKLFLKIKKEKKTIKNKIQAFNNKALKKHKQMEQTILSNIFSASS